MWGGCEADVLENICDHVVPVMGGSAETVQGLLKEPIFILGITRIANRRTDNGKFIVW